MLDKSIYKESDLLILKKYVAKKRSQNKRPIFIFACGGDERYHSSRRQLREYVESSEDEKLQNVFFMSAESVSHEDEMSNFDLLKQEAIIADIADWMVIFAESVGSFCELGAFSSLPHSVLITSVVIDKKYKGSKSFILDGPVKVIDKCNAPLADVFYANMECPLENANLASCIRNIRSRVKESENYGPNRKRKTLNQKEDDVRVGSLAHELLDLIVLFGPISKETLVELYCYFKDFDFRSTQIRSTIISEDFKEDEEISIDQILAAMRASEIIGLKNGPNNEKLYYSKVSILNFFMFLSAYGSEFQNARARILMRRRRKGFPYEESLYRRLDRI